MPTPTSTHGIALDQLKRLVAASATFQTAAGGSETSARARVHFGRQVGSPDRPFALIELDSAAGHAASYGGGNALLPEGSLRLCFERDTVTSDPDPYLEASDWFGRVIDEINALAGADDSDSPHDQTHLPTLSTDFRLGENERSTWHSLGRFFTCQTLVTWGDAA